MKKSTLIREWINHLTLSALVWSFMGVTHMTQAFANTDSTQSCVENICLKALVACIYQPKQNFPTCAIVFESCVFNCELLNNK